MTKTSFGLIALISLVALAGCSKLTVSNYERIRAGMSFDEVEAIIGKASQCDEALAVRSCVWGDEARNIKVNFVAGKAVLFSAHQLK
ncbi:hypothetical protein OPU71_15015 [Niveibacterium sp. 24ML]|uniref:hypothetical protein n=1 Tax=Niveibacterium sp. 24ML TaxID=2985512 RepID=UPI00226DBE43|nr:hypothetical protein [Niveibacterium sp. 24ML]MCX9157437.1 hypothetical protein [Niveibacterium sp. 24ML]